MILALCGDNGIYFDDAAYTGERVMATVDAIQGHAATVGNLPQVIKTDGILKTDPFDRHPRDICP